VKILTEISESLRAWGEFSDDLDLSKAVTSIRPELRRNTASAELHTEASPLDITELMKLVLDLRGRHDAFDLGTVLEPGWWEGPLLEERRVLLQWALGAIAELETHNTNLLTENAILWQRSEEATREADRLRERIAGVRRLVPGPLYSLVTKLTRRS
jgi:hypothetical protein